MKYSSRFFLYAPLGVFLLLVAIVSVHWWSLSSALANRLDAMNGHEVMPGVTLQFAERKNSGFPFGLDTELRDVTLIIATPHGPTRWQTEKFAMHALTYGREETIFEAAGTQTLSWTKDGGEQRTLAFNVGSLHASAIIRNKALARFDLDLVGFGSKPLTAQRIQFHLRCENPDTAAVVLNAEGVVLSPANETVVGKQIDVAQLRASFTHATVFDRLLAGKARWSDALEAWRGGKGSFVIQDFRLDGNLLAATGKGRLSLDDARRPAGTVVFSGANLPTYLRYAAQHQMASGPDQGLAAALIAGANANAETTRMVFGDGYVFIDRIRADTLRPLY